MYNTDKEKQKTPTAVAENPQDDTLSALWQAQPIAAIDLEKVKANLSSERKKQRWYMAIDSLAFVPGAYLLVTYWETLSLVAQTIYLLLICSAIPLLVYQLWLRRVAAFYKDNRTSDHLTQLTKQIKNNVKISFITKHSTWVALLFGFAFIMERILFGELTQEKVTRMIAVMTSMSVAMLIWFIWAHKRQKRFERQLKTLEEIADQLC
ncbi:hypothetical protein [Alteromonas gracilis]|uniref:hypothetical protein n=1 Tax=Alteromonas gracilis TaxID=1479524 RepID=UPI0037368351